MLRLVCALAFLVLAAGCDDADPDPDGMDDWTKLPSPVWEGTLGLAADPDVIRDGDGFRMCYTCLDPAIKGPATCGATSPDCCPNATDV